MARSAHYSFGRPYVDDDGVQITLYRNGMPVCSGLALHLGKGPEETTFRAAKDARKLYRLILKAKKG